MAASATPQPQAQRGQPDVDLTVQPAQPERSLGELFGDMTRDFSTLIRKEVELARTELKEEATTAGKAGAMLGGAAVVGLVAFIILAMTIAFALDAFLWRWVSFLIVTVLLAAVAGVLASIGRKRLAAVNPTPQETVQTLKEDAQWLKEQRS
jgi:uncharacterized membrane protein YqjE